MAPTPSRIETFSLRGLVAATFTPLGSRGELRLARVKPLVNRLIADGVEGLYVLGSTGEGPLLSSAERFKVADAFVQAAAGRLPVVVQVGHNSVREAKAFACHAQSCGADAISATAPCYFKPESIELLIDCSAEIASGAPKLPFYYYHVPIVTGVRFDMVEFLRKAKGSIPTLRGIKFSDSALHEVQECIRYDRGRFDILFGVDEMLLSGLALGVRGAVGSTYNFAAPLYRRLMSAFRRGDMVEAQRFQALAGEMIRAIISACGRAGLKETMSLTGCECGPCRLPLRTLTRSGRKRLRDQLIRIGFFEWARRSES
jgi:N-acetylneuraminate lyase